MFRRKEDDAIATVPVTSGTPIMPGGMPSSSSSSSSAQESTGTSSSITMPASTASSASAGASPSAFSPRSSEPARPAAAPTASASYRPSTPAADFARSAPATARSSEPAMRAAAPASPISSTFGGFSDKSGASKANRRVLTVGNDILLKGEIATCDRLVIEGRVEAKLSEVHTVEIAECGSFKGTAEVEDAEISGIFEGDLIVRNRLVIYATGEVRGNISYGEIEIERGGRLTGQIKTASNPAPSARGKNAEGTESRRHEKKDTAAA